MEIVNDTPPIKLSFSAEMHQTNQFKIALNFKSHACFPAFQYAPEPLSCHKCHHHHQETGLIPRCMLNQGGPAVPDMTMIKVIRDPRGLQDPLSNPGIEGKWSHFGGKLNVCFGSHTHTHILWVSYIVGICLHNPDRGYFKSSFGAYNLKGRGKVLTEKILEDQ